MDMSDRIVELAARLQHQRDTVLTEEAAKTAFVLPFIQTLGYDIFNPAEVVPELTADHGVKKGEKVDYAIKRDGKITMLIECKPVGADLEAKHAGQLFRYFAVTDARFGILTDGVRYLFFTDLEKPNRMDDRPFFEFNILGYNDDQLDELKKFTKSKFDLDTIISTASRLKYHRALINAIDDEFEEPGDDLVKLFTSKVYDGRMTQQVRDEFAVLVKNALRDFIRKRVNDRLKSALEKGGNDEPVEDEAPVIDSSGIVTTDEEMEAHRIVQAIGAELTDPARIVIRDAKSYCAILFDDNNRRPICRLHFGKNKMSIAIFAPDNEAKFDINTVRDLYQHKSLVLEAIKQWL